MEVAYSSTSETMVLWVKSIELHGFATASEDDTSGSALISHLQGRGVRRGSGGGSSQRGMATMFLGSLFLALLPKMPKTQDVRLVVIVLIRKLARSIDGIDDVTLDIAL